MSESGELFLENLEEETNLIRLVGRFGETETQQLCDTYTSEETNLEETLHEQREKKVQRKQRGRGETTKQHRCREEDDAGMVANLLTLVCLQQLFVNQYLCKFVNLRMTIEITRRR